MRFERLRISLIVARKILCTDLMKVPERKIIRSNVHHVRNHVLGRRDSVLRNLRARRLAGEALLKQRRNPWRAIAQRFNLLVLNVDGIAANPVVAAHSAVEKLGVAHAAVVRLRICEQWVFVKCSSCTSSILIQVRSAV